MGEAAAGRRHRPTGVALSASKLVAALVLLAAPETVPEPCRVIVNRANPATQIQRAALAAIYMGAMTRWSDGTPIAPVDQSTRSAVRAAFSEKLLGKSLQAMQSHWLRKMAAQNSTPPPVKPSDAAVAAWVHAHAGAIGYVRNGFKLDETVRVVKVVDEGKSQGGVK